MTFKELKFEPNGSTVTPGVFTKVFFDNGYGASIIRSSSKDNPFAGSMGGHEGLYELAVLTGTEEAWALCYSTHITSDVIGYLTEEKVTELLEAIEKLPKAE